MNPPPLPSLSPLVATTHPDIDDAAAKAMASRTAVRLTDRQVPDASAGAYRTTPAARCRAADLPDGSTTSERPRVAPGGDAEAACEVSVEMALIDEPGQGRNLRRAASGLEKTPGLHHPLPDLERVRWNTRDGSELSDQVEFRRTGGMGEVIERHVDREVVP